ncbi:MAG TPA: NUDIX domain-containing protein [Acidimicrobiales bacterium]|nr:NUDIX domain-containing protein [Acidimicrobiales bacterium]
MLAALAAYRPGDAEEADHVQRVRALVVEHGDPWSRQQPLHVTASALVVHPPTRRVLLRWHARMRMWLQVGGHGDPGERDPWLIARREAEEETGLVDLVPLTPDLAARLVQVVIVPVPAFGAEGAHEHADLRYVLATSRPDDAVAESPAAVLRWMTLDQALTDTEPNVAEFVRRIAGLLDRSPRSEGRG